jgi:hypothetical protein
MEQIANIEGVLAEQRYDFASGCSGIILPQTGFFQLNGYDDCERKYKKRVELEKEVTGDVEPSIYLKFVDKNALIFDRDTTEINIAGSLKTYLNSKSNVVFDYNPSEEVLVVVDGNDVSFQYLKNKITLNHLIHDFKEGSQCNVSANNCCFTSYAFSAIYLNKKNELALRLFDHESKVNVFSLQSKDQCIKHMIIAQSLLMCLFSNVLELYELSCVPNEVNNEIKNISTLKKSFSPVHFGFDEPKGRFVSFAVHKKMPQSFVLLGLRESLAHVKNKQYELFFVQLQEEPKITHIWSSNSDQEFDNVVFGGSKKRPVILLWNANQTRAITQLVFQEGWSNFVKAE